MCERERRSGCAGWSIFKQGLRSIFKGRARLIGSQQWSICKGGVSLIGEKIDFFDREKKKGRQPSPRAQRPPPWSSWVSAVVHLQRRSKPHGVSEIVHFPIRNEVLFQSKEWAGLGLMIFLMIFLMKSRAGRPAGRPAFI